MQSGLHIRSASARPQAPQPEQALAQGEASSCRPAGDTAQARSTPLLPAPHRTMRSAWISISACM